MKASSPKRPRPPQTSFAAWDSLSSMSNRFGAAIPPAVLDGGGWISSALIGEPEDYDLPPIEYNFTRTALKSSVRPASPEHQPVTLVEVPPSHLPPPTKTSATPAPAISIPAPTLAPSSRQVQSRQLLDGHTVWGQAAKSGESTLRMTDKELGFAIPSSWRTGGKLYETARRAELTPTTARFRLTDGNEDTWLLWFEIWADFVRANGNKRPSYRSTRKKRNTDWPNDQEGQGDVARELTALSDGHSPVAEEALLLTAIPRDGPGYLYGGRLHNWVMSQKRNNRLSVLGSGETGEIRKKTLVNFLREIQAVEKAQDTSSPPPTTPDLTTHQPSPNPPSIPAPIDSSKVDASAVPQAAPQTSDAVNQPKANDATRPKTGDIVRPEQTEVIEIIEV